MVRGRLKMKNVHGDSSLFSNSSPWIFLYHAAHVQSFIPSVVYYYRLIVKVQLASLSALSIYDDGHRQLLYPALARLSIL